MLVDFWYQRFICPFIMLDCIGHKTIFGFAGRGFILSIFHFLSTTTRFLQIYNTTVMISDHRKKMTSELFCRSIKHLK